MRLLGHKPPLSGHSQSVLAQAASRRYLCGMDAQQIKAFIDAMAASDLAEMEASKDGWTLRMVRRPRARAAPASRASSASCPAGTKPLAMAGHEQRAALGGIVFLQPGPGEPPFVQVGMPVEAGQPLCVIEAMKVFHEVRAERSGTVAALLVESGQDVEAGQALVRFA